MPSRGGTHEQHVKAGQQSHKGQDKDKETRQGQNPQQQAQGDDRRQQGGGKDSDPYRKGSDQKR